MKIQISLQLCTLYEDISTFIAHSDIQLLSSSEMVSCCYDSQGGINVMHTRARAHTHTQNQCYMYTIDLVYIWFLTKRTQHRTQDSRIKSIKITIRGYISNKI